MCRQAVGKFGIISKYCEGGNAMIDYLKLFSEKVLKIEPSGIRKFFDFAEGDKDVISLGVGEPDFDTPLNVRECAIDTINRSQTKYSSNTGMIELREEISKYLIKSININYNPSDEILVTVGCSEGIDLAIRTFVNPGDEVIVVEPSFVAYAPIVEISGGVVVRLNTTVEQDFKVCPKKLQAVITNKTKMLILSFPNNPTGGIMTKSDIEPLVDIIVKSNIVVLSDEVYSELTYESDHSSIAEFPGMKERTILINGFSKTYAMTGWRLGYVAAPDTILKQMNKIHQYAIMCAPTISQYAAIEALKNSDEYVQTMKAEYKRRRDYIVDRLNKMGLKCTLPKGAFYVFPSITTTKLTSNDFCLKLLKEHKVAIVPGCVFGECGEGFVRISYSYAVEYIERAMDRLEIFVKSLI